MVGMDILMAYVFNSKDNKSHTVGFILIFFLSLYNLDILLSSMHIHHKKLITIAIIFLFSWIVGTFLIHRFETGYPIGESYFNALYFTVITTATIGF